MFALFNYYSSFYWLQNIDDSELGFTLSYGLALFEEFEMHPLFGYSDPDPEAEDKHAVMLIVGLKEPENTPQKICQPLYLLYYK